jgi:predicted Zn-dependent protease
MEKAILLIVCLVFTLNDLHCSKVHNTVGTVGSYLVSDSEEVAIGENFHEQIVNDSVNFPLYENNPEHNEMLVDYIDSLGQLIADGQDDRDDIEYHFTIIDNDTTVNAFATPGGFIYIYTGLIKEAQYESEIAGVLGHELGHITKRHGVKLLVANNATDFVLDLIVGDSTTLRNVIDLANGLSFLKYSRVNEYEADSLGTEYLISAGLNPTGMQTFLEFLVSYAGVSFEPLATHPDGEKRVEAVEQLISSKDSALLERPNPEKKYTP